MEAESITDLRPETDPKIKLETSTMVTTKKLPEESMDWAVALPTLLNHY